MSDSISRRAVHRLCCPRRADAVWKCTDHHSHTHWDARPLTRSELTVASMGSLVGTSSRPVDKSGNFTSDNQVVKMSNRVNEVLCCGLWCDAFFTLSSWIKLSQSRETETQSEFTYKTHYWTKEKIKDELNSHVRNEHCIRRGNFFFLFLSRIATVTRRVKKTNEMRCKQRGEKKKIKVTVTECEK